MIAAAKAERQELMASDPSVKDMKPLIRLRVVAFITIFTDLCNTGELLRGLSEPQRDAIRPELRQRCRQSNRHFIVLQEARGGAQAIRPLQARR